MKTIVLSLTLIVSLNQIHLIGQTNPEMKVTELMFLVDITDAELYGQIKADFQNNLPQFFNYTHLGRIKDLEMFRLSVAPINSTGELIITCKSIQIPKKGMPTNDVKKLSNPQPLMAMLREQLNVFEAQVANNDRSLIMEVVLKAVNQANENAERNIIVICSDLLEFSNTANFYRKIPSPQEVDQVIKNLDSITWSSAKRKAEKTQPEIIIIYRQSPGFKQARELKLFWCSLMNKLGIKSVVFIDNFTQDPQI